ncbi:MULTISPECIES: di-heme oxidoredictase family protein [Pseudomonadati]|uniref:di-heme oxidoreductase family protein n=1 Tax=unclassified Halobacteriovorax TaxID=2639665 RepID=UPI000CD1DB1A|nr:di-heme oxidoredictase family protein [Halobacteriovorax sp. DA5]POB13437.1 thiol oxidoreductase [Halobacteriovorax sp. DA5]
MVRALLLTFLCVFSLNTYSSDKFPAGAGTTLDLSVNAFSHPMSGTRGMLRRQFQVGNSFFKGAWVTSPSSTPLRDGLGPIFNATSCTACHLLDGRGRGLPDVDGKTDISLLFRLKKIGANGETTPHSKYGDQFQPHSIEGVKGEGEVFAKFETIKGKFADGQAYELKKPNYIFRKLAYGKLGNNTIVSPRVAPQMIGLGLLENINEEDILAGADPEDLDNDGISGRANYVFSIVEQRQTLGRFGWKASRPNLLEQNAAAFNGDLGITSSLFPTEECSLVQIDCLEKQTQQDISNELLDKVTLYTQLISVPVRRDFNSPSVLNGKKVFHQINCQACHRPEFTTGTNSKFEVLNNQKIYPYTDMLLHDMGDELADDTRSYQFEAKATTREWRTPPLWGLGLVKTVNGHTRYLHDGRARNLQEAILWHGGEAKQAKNNFIKLTKKDRNDLIKFLRSL